MSIPKFLEAKHNIASWGVGVVGFEAGLSLGGIVDGDSVLGAVEILEKSDQVIDAIVREYSCDDIVEANCPAGVDVWLQDGRPGGVPVCG